jgi:hypothetical protein
MPLITLKPVQTDADPLADWLTLEYIPAGPSSRELDETRTVKVDLSAELPSGCCVLMIDGQPTLVPHPDPVDHMIYFERMLAYYGVQTWPVTMPDELTLTVTTLAPLTDKVVELIDQCAQAFASTLLQ